MVQIDFHTDVADRLAHACRVARKALRGENHVAIVGPQAVLERMDHMLWNMAEHDFVAHCRADAPEQVLQASRIVLALPGQVLAHHEVLLNVGDDVPPDFEAYGRVVEVVGNQDAADLQAGRQRWRRYRELGHQPVRHVLSA